MTAREAICEKCGEVFNPVDDQDLEHIEKSDGTPCGGQGELTGSW